MFRKHELGWIALVVAIFIGFAGACTLFYLFMDPWITYQNFSPTPRTIPLQELIDQGRGVNRNVQVTGFQFGEGSVYITKNNKWETVYVPLIPMDDHLPGERKNQLDREIVVFLKSTRIKDRNDLEQLARQPAIQGLIIEHDLSEKNTLKPHFPGVDYSKCIILDEGRQPPSEMLVYGILGGGTGAIAFGGVLAVAASIFLLIHYRRRQRTERLNLGVEEVEPPRPRCPPDQDYWRNSQRID
jgi:hypothetical protein